MKALFHGGQVVGGRTIAVDWAVSKAQFQSASAADAPGGLSDTSLFMVMPDAIKQHVGQISTGSVMQ